MKKFLGAELFFETLHKLGIKTIFGLPGGYVLKIYDVMPSYAKKINHIYTVPNPLRLKKADALIFYILTEDKK